jgi:hypothetical protein
MTKGLVIAMLAVGFLLRFWGVNYGLPFPLVSDEEVLLGGALKMLEIRSLVPALHPEAMSILYYPLALPYLYLVLMAPVIAGLYILNGLPPMDQFGLIILDNLGSIWLAARFSSVLMSTATLYIVYRLGSSLFRTPVAGLMAAYLMAFDYMHVMLGHVARHWSATVLLIWAVAWVSFKYFEKPDLRRAVAIGLLSGIGFGVSYIGALGFGFGGVAHLANWRQGRVSLLGRNSLAIAGGCAVLVALFIALYPQLLFRYRTILPIAEAKSITGWLEASVFYVAAIWMSNPALLVMAVAGLVVAAMTRRWLLLGGSVFLIIFYTVFLYRAMPIEDRYILPLSPALALLGGFAANEAWQRFGNGRRARTALLLACIGLMAYPLAVSSRAAYLLAQEDTRMVAKKWLERNLPADALIAMNTNVVRLTPSLEALSAQKALDAGSLKAVDRLRLAKGASVGPEERNVLNLWQLSSAGLKMVDVESLAGTLRQRGYRYYVVDGFGARQIPRLNTALMQDSEMVARFSSGDPAYLPPALRTTTLVPYAMHHLFSSDRFGPEVVVVKLPGNN